MLQDPRYHNRELKINLLLTPHPNLMLIKHAFYTQGDSQQVYLNLVMPYVPDTVHKVTRHYHRLKQQVPTLLVKLYAYQMFRGLAHL